MAETITLADELYREFASYGNRDESHNTILRRILDNINKEEAMKDRQNRETVFEQEEEKKEQKRKNPAVQKLEDETPVRWAMSRGPYSGQQRIGYVTGARIQYDGETWSPTGFAREADQDIRGDDARGSEAYSGPKEVEYQTDGGDWVRLKSVHSS